MKFLSANLIHDGIRFRERSVLILDNDNVVIDLAPINEVAKEKIIKHEGIICPGFVNTHCHVELSHLIDQIPVHTGLADFVKEVITLRESGSEIERSIAIQEALDELIEEGVVAVGDICNTTDTLALKSKSQLFFHNFFEVSGFIPKTADIRFNIGLKQQQEANMLGGNMTNSITPHAPYSTSPELIQLCIDHNPSLISIHSQESIEEQKFFEFGQGKILDIYAHLGLGIEHFVPSRRSSLDTISTLLNQTKQCLLVHNTFITENDLKVLKSLTHTQPYFAICGIANLYIENTLPPLELIHGHFADNICLGTDSLASNNKLSIMNEINLLMDNFEFLDLEMCLKFACYNGAKALGIDSQFGSFEKGKKPGINLISNESFITPLI